METRIKTKKTRATSLRMEPKMARRKGKKRKKRKKRREMAQALRPHLHLPAVMR